MGCMSHRAGTQKRHHQLVSPASHDPTSSLQLLLGPPFVPKPWDLRGAPSAISMAVIPRDQMSLCRGMKRGTGERC